MHEFHFKMKRRRCSSQVCFWKLLFTNSNCSSRSMVHRSIMIDHCRSSADINSRSMVQWSIMFHRVQSQTFTNFIIFFTPLAEESTK